MTNKDKMKSKISISKAGINNLAILLLFFASMFLGADFVGDKFQDLTYSMEKEFILSIFKSFTVVAPYVLAVMAFALVFFSYLGSTSTREEENNEEEIVLSSNIKEMSERIERIEAQAIGVNDEDKARIIEEVRSSVFEDSTAEVLGMVEKNYSEKVMEEAWLKNITLGFRTTRDRLRLEVINLTKRANINLFIGITITIGGVLFLLYIVVASPPSYKGVYEALAYNLPRYSLVILIEVFAYFFLKIYKSALEDIQYYQNEITTIEARMLALRVALWKGQEDLIKIGVEQTATMDRNKGGKPGLNVEVEGPVLYKLLSEFIKQIKPGKG